jgi:hypothetical protein
LVPSPVPSPPFNPPFALPSTLFLYCFIRPSCTLRPL